MNKINLINDFKEIGKIKNTNTRTVEELRAEKERELQNNINTACNYKLEEAKNLAMENMPKDTINQTLDYIKNTWEQEEQPQIKACIDFITNFSEKTKGLYLYSKQSGTGKTTLAGATARGIFNHLGKSIYFASEEHILGKIKKSYNSDYGDDEIKIIRNIAKHDLIVIDELGQNKTDWAVKTLKRLLDEIINQGSKILITSNYSYKELAKIYLANQSNLDNRTVYQLIDRLKGMTRPIQFGNKSYR